MKTYPDAKSFHHELRSFDEFGAATLVEDRQFGDLQVSVYQNEFWTAKQRDGHSLHEVSYRACYKPQLPGFFISRFCQPDDLVYDPFMGRGTTLIEAQLHGCRSAGNDANPLSGILSAPRLDPPSLEEIKGRLDQVELQHSDSVDPDLLVFFSPETLDELYSWRSYFRQRRAAGNFDKIDAWIQMVACNRLTGHSAGFFSVYTLPPNQAVSVERQRKINAKREQSPEYRDTKVRIFKKSRQLLRHDLSESYPRRDFKILNDSADQTKSLESESVSLVVTSPPFLDVVDYVQDNWMRMWFCELELERSKIWQLKSIEDWVARMSEVFVELKRVLKPKGVIAFEVGEVRNGKVLLENEVVKAAMSAGLTPEGIMINSQDFTKTANCWGVDNNAKGTNSNRIVILKK